MRAIVTFLGRVAYSFLMAEPYIIFLLVRPFTDMPEGLLGDHWFGMAVAQWKKGETK